MITPTSTTKQLIPIINQLFIMETKIGKGAEEMKGLQRNLDRIKRFLEEMGLSYHNPIGEFYDETRTDCEASISGDQTEDLKITEVIKPIIRQEIHGLSTIVQRAVVIVEGR